MRKIIYLGSTPYTVSGDLAHAIDYSIASKVVTNSNATPSNTILPISEKDGKLIEIRVSGANRYYVSSLGSDYPIGAEVIVYIPPIYEWSTSTNGNNIHTWVEFVHSEYGAGLDMSITREVHTSYSNDGDYPSFGYRALPNASTVASTWDTSWHPKRDIFALHEQLTFLHMGNGRWKCIRLPDSQCYNRGESYITRHANGTQTLQQRGRETRTAIGYHPTVVEFPVAFSSMSLTNGVSGASAPYIPAVTPNAMSGVDEVTLVHGLNRTNCTVRISRIDSTAISFFLDITGRYKDAIPSLPVNDDTNLFAESALFSFVTPQLNNPIGIISKNPTDIRRPASLTKLMTAYIVMRLGISMSTTITIVASDATTGSGNNLQTGDIITIEDAFANLLLPSSNVTATAIARYVGDILTSGSDTDENYKARFIQEMNSVATEIGMNNTVFMNPHGLHDENQYTTVYDMWVLVNRVMNDYGGFPLWGNATYDITVAGPNARTFAVTSSNQIATNVNVSGGKTGTLTGVGTEFDTHNLVVVGNLVENTATNNTFNYVAIVMKSGSSANRYTDMNAILDQMNNYIGNAAYP